MELSVFQPHSNPFPFSFYIAIVDIAVKGGLWRGLNPRTYSLAFVLPSGSLAGKVTVRRQRGGLPRTPSPIGPLSHAEGSWEWTVGIRQWAVSGLWKVDSGQWAVDSRQCTVLNTLDKGKKMIICFRGL